MCVLPSGVLAATIKGKVGNTHDLLNPVWNEAKDPAAHRFTFREPSPSVPPDVRILRGHMQKELCIVALTEDDTDPPTVNMHAEEGAPSVSDERLNAMGAAIWAVYDLHRIGKSLGPRVDPIRKDATPGRNDPCPCGSGKKYKKCHGA